MSPFGSNVDFKKNNINYRKSFWIFWLRQRAGINFCNSILINNETAYDTVMKRHLHPLLNRAGGNGPALRRPCLLDYFFFLKCDKHLSKIKYLHNVLADFLTLSARFFVNLSSAGATANPSHMIMKQQIIFLQVFLSAKRNYANSYRVRLL